MSKTIIKTIIYMAFDIEMIKKCMSMTSRVDAAREIVGHHTLTEKILYNHLWDGKPSKAFARELIMLIFFLRQSSLSRCNSSNGLLQFMHAGKAQVAVPTVHCDHLIQAKG
jgi:aconitate hydratase